MNTTPTRPIEIVVVGSGMIVHDQILPSLYHLQRLGETGPITVCDTSSKPLRALAGDPILAQAFPGQTFTPRPSVEEPPERTYADLYKQAIGSLGPRNLVVVAVPDALHEMMIREALAHGQHVLTVKPLVQTYAASVEIAETARAQGLMVGVEYHKRFDRRSLDARRQYREGRLGEFRLGEAKMIEPYYYRHSNFQNWFTRESADPFTYVGCHYVNLVQFITGLRPVEVSVRGVEGTFPNGNIGYLWSAGQVLWENGAVLSVTNGLGYPDRGAGSNDQGLCLFCEGPDAGGLFGARRPVPRRQPRLPRRPLGAPTSALSAPTISASCPGKARASSRWAMATIRSVRWWPPPHGSTRPATACRPTWPWPGGVRRWTRSIAAESSPRRPTASPTSW